MWQRWMKVCLLSPPLGMGPWRPWRRFRWICCNICRFGHVFSHFLTFSPTLPPSHPPPLHVSTQLPAPPSRRCDLGYLSEMMSKLAGRRTFFFFFFFFFFLLLLFLLLLFLPPPPSPPPHVQPSLKVTQSIKNPPGGSCDGLNRSSGQSAVPSRLAVDWQPEAVGALIPAGFNWLNQPSI